MAIPKAVSGTLVAGVASGNLFTDALISSKGLTVINRSQSGTIWVSVTTTPPTEAGADCFPVLGVRRFTAEELANDQLRLFSAAATAYTVESA